MGSFATLIWREWLEHKGAYVWSPVVIFALIVLAVVTFTPTELMVDINTPEHRQKIEVMGNEGDASAMNVIVSMLLDVAGSTDDELQHRLAAILQYTATPFYWVWLVISFFALIACIHDERTNRSVLFFKSMPVSDLETVVSKYTFVAWLAPIPFIAMLFLAQLFVVLMLSTWVEDGMGSRVWLNSNLLVVWFQVLIGYLLNGLVLAPVFGWLIFVSAWANRMPFIWALGVPFWLVVVDSIVLDFDWISRAISYHGSMPTLPRASVSGDFPQLSVNSTSLMDQLSVLAHGQFWVGLVVGAGLLAAAVYYRQRNNLI